MARTPKKIVRSSAAATDPSTPSLFYKDMAPRWNMISTVLGGTETMRAAGEAYLPKHEGESRLRYRDRAASAVFTNYTQMTLEFWVGKPFSRPVVFTKDTDQALLDIEDDMDLCGNTLSVVLEDWFSRGLEKRVSYCLVEFPEVEVPENGIVTAKQVEDENIRPYWTIMPAEAVISAVKKRIKGEDEFVHVRFWDNEVIQDGYEEKIKIGIREYNRVEDAEGNVQVTVVKHTKSTDRDEWIRGPVKVLTQESITFVEFDVGKLMLKDLAYLNITHYQSSSDQRNCLTTARFPILAGSGVEKDTVVTIGPYNYLSSSDPSSEFYYVEHSGAALGAGQTDIDGLVDSMAMYGAEMLKERPDRQTATSAILDTAQNMAPLQVVVFKFKSAVEQALYYTKKWMELPETAISKIEINTDFAMTKEQNIKVDNLKDGRAKGDISRKQFLTGMVEAKALPESFNITANETELSAEALQKGQEAATNAKALAEAVPQPKPSPGNTPQKE